MRKAHWVIATTFIAIAATRAKIKPAPPPFVAHSSNTPIITIIMPIII